MSARSGLFHVAQLVNQKGCDLTPLFERKTRPWVECIHGFASRRGCFTSWVMFGIPPFLARCQSQNVGLGFAIKHLTCNVILVVAGVLGGGLDPSHVPFAMFVVYACCLRRMKIDEMVGRNKAAYLWSVLQVLGLMVFVSYVVCSSLYIYIAKPL